LKEVVAQTPTPQELILQRAIPVVSEKLQQIATINIQHHVVTQNSINKLDNRMGNVEQELVHLNSHLHNIEDSCEKAAQKVNFYLSAYNTLPIKDFILGFY
jgi:hypothetical protein